MSEGFYYKPVSRVLCVYVEPVDDQEDKWFCLVNTTLGVKELISQFQRACLVEGIKISDTYEVLPTGHQFVYIFERMK